MKIKLTYPLQIGDRLYEAGEIIDAAEVDAKQLLTNGLAIEVAEVKKHDGRKKRSKVL
jgi:glycine/serine hydroxymethyltransferase